MNPKRTIGASYKLGSLAWKRGTESGSGTKPTSQRPMLMSAYEREADYCAAP
jgi:hypothetical protein